MSGGDKPRIAWLVNGEPFRNAAAVFWARWISEAGAAYPDWTEGLFTTTGAEVLSPDRLDPAAELQRDAERLAGLDLAAVMRETAAELELLGPPAAVTVTVQASPGEAPRPGNSDGLDSEVFSYLVCWLLHWARVPAPLWNGPEASGSFRTHMPGLLPVRIGFTLRHEPLAEGLRRRSLTLARQADT